MAKTNKKTAEKTTKEKIVKKEVVVEGKKRGRPKKEEEKLPTASLKELEEQGSNYVIDETPKEEEVQAQEPEQEIKSDSIEIQNLQESISSTTVENNDTTLENTNDETHEEFLNKQAELMAQDISNKIDSEIVNNIIAENLELSPMAQKYKAYIEYTKMTPEQFIAKYPNHKFIRFVHEIVEWKVKTGAQ